MVTKNEMIKGKLQLRLKTKMKLERPPQRCLWSCFDAVFLTVPALFLQHDHVTCDDNVMMVVMRWWWWGCGVEYSDRQGIRTRIYTDSMNIRQIGRRTLGQRPRYAFVCLYVSKCNFYWICRCQFFFFFFFCWSFGSCIYHGRIGYYQYLKKPVQNSCAMKSFRYINLTYQFQHYATLP